MAEHTSSPTLGSTPGSNYTSQQSSQSSPNSGTASRIVANVKERATAQLSTQKDRATDGLGSVASAVRQTTQSLRDQQHDTVAGYVEQAADQIERLSERLKNKDVTELLDDAQRLARRQPALFVGGAFALGLVGARFLKSSSRDEYEYRGGASESYGSTSRPYSTGSTHMNVGTAGSTGDVTGRASMTDLGATGAAGYTGSSANREGGRGTTGTSSAASGSTYGSTGVRNDRERF